MIQVVIVSPVLAVRAGLRALLHSTWPDSGRGNNLDDGVDHAGRGIEVINELPDLSDAENSIGAADILLVTENVVSEDEIDTIAQQYGEELALLLLSDDYRSIQFLPTQSFRAWGILPLDSSSDELRAAIRALYEGLIVGTPEMIHLNIEKSKLSIDAGDASMVESLTDRETEVLELIAQGLANKQIAVSLNISEHTVKFHVSSIYSKIGATNRAEVVRLGLQQGLISL